MIKKTILIFFLFIPFINTASALVTYTNEEKNYMIGYPSDWSVFKNYAGADLVLSDPYGYASVNIVITPSGGMGLTQIANQNKVALNQLGAYPYDENVVAINNVKGFEWKLLLTNYYTGIVYEEKQVYLLSGDKVYIITAASPQYYYLGYSDDFDEIINSFEIITTPTQITTYPPATPIAPAAPVVTPAPTNCKQSASVQLYGEKTDVVLGEDIVLKLSAVNLITKPAMTVQVILLPPSGMSVTSADFVQQGPGQYTSTYKLDPGSGRNIEVRIKTNQMGDFEVKGRVVYYYGEDKSTAEDCTLPLSISVRSESSQGVPKGAEAPKTPGFVGVLAIVSILVVVRLLSKAK